MASPVHPHPAPPPDPQPDAGPPVDSYPGGHPAPPAGAVRIAPAPPSFPLPAGLAVEPAWYLHRERLDSLFERLQTPDARVLVLWDAAGSGKTTLMAGWARLLLAANQSVEWVSGADLNTVGVAAEVRSRLTADGSGTDEVGAGPRFLFIDDLHRAETPGPDGRTELIGLLNGLAGIPAGVRLVVSGRHRPGAGTAPLEAAGVLIECSDALLAFTLAETFQLAALHHVDLSADDAAALWRHTGGWATGLALALTWRHADGNSLDVSRFDGDNPAVADYLATEVVTGLDDGDRDVLLRSALSDVVALDLAVAVSDRSDAGEVLERISRRNTLIGRENDAHGGSGYRYHPILLAYLQAEGRRRDAGASSARHLLASRWYSDRADGAAAVEQSLLAHDPDRAGELLERFGLDLILTGRPGLVRRALAQLRGRADTASTLCLRVLLEPPSGPAGRGPHHLLEAAAGAVRARPGTAADRSGTDTWAFLVEVLQALHATQRADIATRYEALHDSPLAATARQDLSVDLLAALAEGRCLDRLGQSGAAEAGLRQVSEAARSAGFDWLFLQASDLAATAAGHTGNWLHVAMLEGQMAAALTGEPPPTDWPIIGPTAGPLADPAARPIDHAAGRALLYSMIHRYEHCQPLDVETLLHLASPDTMAADAGVAVPAEVLLLLDQLDAAARSRHALDRLLLLMREQGFEHPRALSLCCIPLVELSDALDGRTETQSIVRMIERALGEDSLEALLIKFLLAPPTRAGHPAEERLQSAALDERSAWRGATIVRAWIALAHVAELTGRHVESDLRLLKGLRLASRIGCERAFLAGGGEGVALLRARLGRLGDLDEYARHVLTAADGTHPDERGRSQDHGQSSPTLTPREREVLRELPFHQSVANIARKRNVSPNTVKTHLRNIYQKLEAANRADAVAIAHDHGLL